MKAAANNPLPACGEQVGGEEAGKVGRIDCRGKNERGEDIGVEEEAGDEDGDGCDAGEEGAEIGDGQSFEDPEIEQIGKEHVPLEDGDDAHGDEGIEDEEEVMIDLEPVGWQGRGEWVISSELDDRVVDGPQVDGDHEGGKADGNGDLDEAGFGVAVGRGGFVVEEALEEVADKQRELAALGWMDDAERGLRVEREGLRVGHGEEALEVVRHGRAA